MMNQLATTEGAELAVNQRTRDLIVRGVSENTLKAYRRALKELEAWMHDAANGCRVDGNGNGGHGLNDSVLAAYLTELHDSGKSPATVSQVVAAVKWQAKNLGRETVVGAFTERTLAGIRREGKERGRGQVDGITWRAMESVCAHAEASRTLSGLRDSALIRLMSDCLLRISEAVAVNVEHIRSGVLEIESSKTDQEGAGATLYIGEPTRRVIRRYCTRAAIETGALFRRIRRGGHITDDRLTVRGARAAIKRWAAESGIDGFISGHSLRVGSAVSLAQAGATVVDMQTACRRKNPKMPAHYAKAELAERGAVARFRYGKRGNN